MFRIQEAFFQILVKGKIETEVQWETVQRVLILDCALRICKYH